MLSLWNSWICKMFIFRHLNLKIRLAMIPAFNSWQIETDNLEPQLFKPGLDLKLQSYLSKSCLWRTVFWTYATLSYPLIRSI